MAARTPAQATHRCAGLPCEPSLVPGQGPGPTPARTGLRSRVEPKEQRIYSTPGESGTRPSPSLEQPSRSPLMVPLILLAVVRRYSSSHGRALRGGQAQRTRAARSLSTTGPDGGPSAPPTNRPTPPAHQREHADETHEALDRVRRRPCRGTRRAGRHSRAPRPVPVPEPAGPKAYQPGGSGCRFGPSTQWQGSKVPSAAASKHVEKSARVRLGRLRGRRDLPVRHGPGPAEPPPSGRPLREPPCGDPRPHTTSGTTKPEGAALITEGGPGFAVSTGAKYGYTGFLLADYSRRPTTWSSWTSGAWASPTSSTVRTFSGAALCTDRQRGVTTSLVRKPTCTAPPMWPMISTTCAMPSATKRSTWSGGLTQAPTCSRTRYGTSSTSARWCWVLRRSKSVPTRSTPRPSWPSPTWFGSCAGAHRSATPHILIQRVIWRGWRRVCAAGPRHGDRRRPHGKQSHADGHRDDAGCEIIPWYGGAAFDALGTLAQVSHALRRGDAKPLLRLAGNAVPVDRPQDDLNEYSAGHNLARTCVRRTLAWDRTARPAVRTAQYAKALAKQPAMYGPFARRPGRRRVRGIPTAALHRLLVAVPPELRRRHQGHRGACSDPGRGISTSTSRNRLQ